MDEKDEVKASIARIKEILKTPVKRKSQALPYKELRRRKDLRMKKHMAMREERLKGEINPKHLEILKLRYGLDDYKSNKLRGIGDIYGVSVERIRQIVAKTERHLKHPSKKNHPLRKQMEVIWNEKS